MRVVVIMAGGSGERFWPISCRLRPKQMLPLLGEKSMLAYAVDRAESLVGLENVYIVAGRGLMPAIEKGIGAVPPENLLSEPIGKNTAPCLAFAAAAIARRHGADASMAVMTSDHLIGALEAFGRNVDLAFEQAEQKNELMTIGIRPTHPNTGFGYLELGEALQNDERGVARRVERFHEKPDLDTARRYLESGNFLWNSGMFFWKIDVLLDAFERYCPELAQGAKKIIEAPDEAAFERTLQEVFEGWPSISIDFAVMEKARNVGAVASLFEWDDVGTWSALARVHPLDENENLIVGEALVQDSKNCIIYNQPFAHCAREDGPEQPIVAALGVEDLVVVSSDHAVLVCKRDREQDIKQLLETLRERGKLEYL